MIFRSADKEYLPITGMVEFNKLSAKLIFGADRYKTLHFASPFFVVKLPYSMTCHIVLCSNLRTLIW